MKTRAFAAALIAFAGAPPAAAQTPVPVGAFESIELQGGGRVTVRHGSRQSVTLVAGSLETTRFSVDRNGRLEIDACVRNCPGYELVVEVVTPALDGVGVRGGGSIRAEGAFPARDSLALGISGGGEIDMTAIQASSVAAGIDGGGEIATHARDRLVAGINGGGVVRYRGSPTVTSGIDGGGSVEPIETR